jgi:hypothetical protein
MITVVMLSLRISRNLSGLHTNGSLALAFKEASDTRRKRDKSISQALY